MSDITLREYQSRAVASAVYPSQHRVTYPALALPGEVGEVAEKILFKAPAAEVSKEIGGVLWYCAALAQDLGIELADIANAETIKEIEAATALTTKLVGPEPNGNREFCLTVCVSSGKIANQVKKILRGDFVLTPEKVTKISKDLNDVVYGLSFLAQEYGLKLSEIAEENIAVLTSRKERGTLLGDGDNR